MTGSNINVEGPLLPMDTSKIMGLDSSTEIPWEKQ